VILTTVHTLALCPSSRLTCRQGPIVEALFS
jgi:hypothetical protein